MTEKTTNYAPDIFCCYREGIKRIFSKMNFCVVYIFLTMREKKKRFNVLCVVVCCLVFAKKKTREAVILFLFMAFKADASL